MSKKTEDNGLLIDLVDGIDRLLTGRVPGYECGTDTQRTFRNYEESEDTIPLQMLRQTDPFRGQKRQASMWRRINLNWFWTRKVQTGPLKQDLKIRPEENRFSLEISNKGQNIEYIMTPDKTSVCYEGEYRAMQPKELDGFYQRFLVELSDLNLYNFDDMFILPMKGRDRDRLYRMLETCHENAVERDKWSVEPTHSCNHD